MAQVFVPPVQQGRPLGWTPLKRNHPGYMLFRHYAPHAAGQNFWIINGVFTTSDPSDSDITLGPNDVALLGSHITPVTVAQAAIITAAGYGANLVEV